MLIEPSILPIKVATEHQAELAIYAVLHMVVYMKKKKSVLVAQLCLTLSDLMDCSPPGSSTHGILQARILDWVAIPFSRGSS